MRKIIKSIAALAFLLLSLGSVSAQDIKVGDKVPNFTYASSKSKSSSIADLKGKVVLVNFFATWCPPCLKELPEVEAQIWAKYGKNSNFAMLTLGREHSWAEVDAFKKKKGFTFPIYPDPKKEAFTKFAPNQIPRSYLIDKSGVVVYATVGYSEQEFAKLLNKLNSLM